MFQVIDVKIHTAHRVKQIIEIVIVCLPKAVIIDQAALEDHAFQLL